MKQANNIPLLPKIVAFFLFSSTKILTFAAEFIKKSKK